MTKLKTLKDLVEKEHFKAVIEHTNKWGTIPMVNYNGDLSAEMMRNTHVSLIKLKQEAIKWVKNWRSEIRYLQEQSLTKDPRDLLTEIKYYEGKIDATMELNNITKEDLKNG